MRVRGVTARSMLLMCMREVRGTRCIVRGSYSFQWPACMINHIWHDRGGMPTSWIGYVGIMSAYSQFCCSIWWVYESHRTPGATLQVSFSGWASLRLHILEIENCAYKYIYIYEEDEGNDDCSQRWPRWLSTSSQVGESGVTGRSLNRSIRSARELIKVVCRRKVHGKERPFKVCLPY